MTNTALTPARAFTGAPTPARPTSQQPEGGALQSWPQRRPRKPFPDPRCSVASVIHQALEHVTEISSWHTLPNTDCHGNAPHPAPGPLQTLSTCHWLCLGAPSQLRSWTRYPARQSAPSPRLQSPWRWVPTARCRHTAREGVRLETLGSGSGPLTGKGKSWRATLHTLPLLLPSPKRGTLGHQQAGAGQGLAHLPQFLGTPTYQTPGTTWWDSVVRQVSDQLEGRQAGHLLSHHITDPEIRHVR